MRYIGSKIKLLDIIREELSEFASLPDGSIFCDLFAGTNAVSDFFQDNFKIISNDNLMFCYLLGRGKLIKISNKFKKLGFDPFEYFNSVNCDNYINGYCYNNFAPSISGRMYFSDENAKRIDFIRDTIDKWLIEEKISLEEHDYLLACLLESISKVSNVAGVYAAFLRIWDSRALKTMQFIDVEHFNKPRYKNIVFNENSNDLIKNIKGDILYLDPPYTSTQYISQYHVLETIARNDRPVHHGLGAHRDNGNQISLWSKKHYVGKELFEVLRNASFDYIILSYSDAGLMSKKFIESMFKRFCGENTKFLDIDFIKYKNTRAVAREIRNNSSDKSHYEYLFMGKKFAKPLFISPLNYIGGKFDVLDFILPLFPTRINTFYDLFGGGGTVSINIDAKRNVYNDLNFNVTNLLKYLSITNPCDNYKYIEKTIKKYGLSKENKDAYISFRAQYNSKPLEDRNPLDLYLLICFGFEHQIRFNSKMEFNNPCGNSGFNDEMLEKLISFSCEAKHKNIEFYSLDYELFESKISKGDFVYCDPPYLLTCGAYNDGKRGFNGWNIDEQRRLLSFLKRLNDKKVKFALSYIIGRNNEVNEELKKWVENNNFNLHINSKITRRNRQDRREVLITNY